MLADATETPRPLDPDVRDFDAFLASVGPRLDAVLVAHYGHEIGPDAAAEARAYAWQHWDTVGQMANPVGYLYRVGQSAARRQFRWRRPLALPSVPAGMEDSIHPDLPVALATLSRQQRVAVVLVHAFGWTLEEAAAAQGVSVSTLRNHLKRGMAKLADLMGDDDA